MFITNLFKLNYTCKHEHVMPETDCAYCPDCGKFIKNEWYITRCACCGVKLRTMVRNGKIEPELKYCSNCGSKEFSVEQIEQINFIDIKFAALLKKEIEDEHQICSTTRCWQEKTSAQPKLLVQYL